MTKLHEQVLEFHRVFDHPIADGVCIPPDERVRFRLRFIIEEALEAVEATFGSSDTLRDARLALALVIDAAPINVDLPKLIDAFADIDYVVEGARIEFGVDGEPIADEVHRANMRKRGGGRVGEKTAKPPGWTPPDIEGELRKQGWHREFPPQPIHTSMPADEKLSLLMRLIRDAEAHQWSLGSIIQLMEAAKK